MEGTECARAEQGDFLARYFGRRLGEAEAQAFEAHYFGCEHCWAEVHAAAEIRDAKGLDVFAAPPAERSRSARDVWTLLAAAAAVAVMVFGLRQLAQRFEVTLPQPVWRGSSAEALPLTITRDAQGQVVLRWLPHPEAQVYVVEIFASDGESLWKRETSETTVSLDGQVLESKSPDVSFRTRVEALDTMRQVV